MATQTDPVCGMKVEEQNSAGTSEYNKTIYYFCSQACRLKFDATPERYAGQAT